MKEIKQNKLILTDENCFSAKDILECGQIFRYRHEDGVWKVFSKDNYAEVRENGCKVEITTDTPDYFYSFFDLATDYDALSAEIASTSPIMREACAYGKGIRILRQDTFETLVSFIISANNNIKRIQGIIERICVELGSKTPYGYAFPTLEQLSGADESFFKAVGAGYRAAYLEKVCSQLASFDLTQLDALSTDEARSRLLAFSGVGPKVADCVLLFGLARGDVFPVDTWMKKVYHAYFENGLKDDKLSGWFREYFGKNSGLAQQYLFYFQRKYGQTAANVLK